MNYFKQLNKYIFIWYTWFTTQKKRSEVRSNLELYLKLLLYISFLYCTTWVTERKIYVLRKHSQDSKSYKSFRSIKVQVILDNTLKESGQKLKMETFMIRYKNNEHIELCDVEIVLHEWVSGSLQWALNALSNLKGHIFFLKTGS